MPSRAEEELQDALRSVLARAVRYHGQRIEYATVQHASPMLVVELHEGSEVLREDEELLLPRDLRQEARTLDPDDAVTLALMQDGRYVVVGLVSDEDAADRLSEADLDAHAALKTGVHGIPAMTPGQGLMWSSAGGGSWVATDLATQAELDAQVAALDGRLDTIEDLSLHGYLLGRGQGAVGAGNAAATIWASDIAAGGFNSAALSTVPPGGWFYWDPADYPAPQTGWVRKWLLRGQLVNNSATVGTITYQMGVRRFTVGGGAGGVAYSFIASDSEARAVSFVNPVGGTSLPAPTLIDPPAAAHYGFYYGWNTTTALNTYIEMALRVYLVYVPA